MLRRVENWFEFFQIAEEERVLGMQAAVLAGERANGMTATKDYEALAAIAFHVKPSLVLEIGTYLGITADFFLTLLPECRVVSIAYHRPKWSFLGKSFNNSELNREQIGSAVSMSRRNRFTQLYGNSHKLQSQRLIESYGYFDLVFIDGDHSLKGVSKDTQLATQVIRPSGVISWHDANPKPKYEDVRHFLESELPLALVATKDDYEGGVACWSSDIEAKLRTS
jgi:predicted O-methyltransferase YrrM